MSSSGKLHVVTDDSQSAQPEADVRMPPGDRRGGSVFIVDFSELGNSAAFRKFGWSGQEDTHVWTLGGTSEVHLPAPARITPLVVELDFDICTVESTITTAVVRVFANGVAIGSACARGRTRLCCDIPESLLVAGAPVELRFEHPCYVRLDFTNLGPDDRVLGLCFYSISIYPPWLKAAVVAAVPYADGHQSGHTSPPVPTPDSAPSKRMTYQFSGAPSGGLPLGPGWRLDQDGNAWTNAFDCRVEIPAPARPGQYFAKFAIAPLNIRTVLPAQRITIILNGAVIAQFQTGLDTSLFIPLPPELIVFGGTMQFALLLPNGEPVAHMGGEHGFQLLALVLDSIAIEAVSPAHAGLGRLRSDDVATPTPLAISERFLDEDVEHLPTAIGGALGADVAKIMGQFESLGDNCAFGLAQRKAGSEVLGLLRFATSPLRQLIPAIDDDFRSINEKNRLELRWVPSAPGEFIVFASDYGLRWHTNVFDASVDRDILFAQQAMRISYLRRKFYEGLKAGRKIYTISRAEPVKHPIPLPRADELEYWEERPEALRLAELISLFTRINEYGANTLLYITPCERDRRSGTVELVAPGIMRGYIRDFVISADPAVKDHAEWLRVAANAWLLDQGPNAAFRTAR